MAKTLIHIRKDALKFSAAHMTVFSKGRKENLHGHNYQVELHLEIADQKLENLLPFSLFKSALKKVCEAWDEKVLLPSDCPFFKKIKQTKKEIEFTLCDKRYVLPMDEVVFLPVDNITSESLARTCFEAMSKEMGHPEIFERLKMIEVKIEESPGQGASYVWCP